jgi:D-glycero-D-manno-heptose 1,7-bisphosphate phosphatase
MSPSSNSHSRAVFLDRDGVLVEDVEQLTDADQIRVLPGVPRALLLLRENGFRLVVISNQAVVARGRVTEQQVRELQGELERMIQRQGGPNLDAFYFCPHHPRATLPAYRADCECRKPQPGMLLRAAIELGVDLPSSFMVGDRITDIIAGARAGCRTVLVQTGQHLAPPIETAQPLDLTIQPGFVSVDLPAAAQWILQNK